MANKSNSLNAGLHLFDLVEQAKLPSLDIIAQKITDDLQAALEQFATIAEDLKGRWADKVGKGLTSLMKDC